MDKVVVAMATQIFGAGLRAVPQDQSGEIQFDVPTCPRGTSNVNWKSTIA